VVAKDEQPDKRAIGGIPRQQRRLGVALLQELHDHRRLRQWPPLLLDHRDAPGRVLLVQPRGTIGEVDLDHVELDALLGEDDPDARAVRAARSVVERHHGWTPMTAASCS